MSFTALELYLLELINRARADPVAEAQRLNISLNQGLAPGAITPQSKEPLVFDDELNRAADLHSLDMRIQGYFDHTGLNGSTPTTRAQAAGYSNQSGFGVGENLGLLLSTARDFNTEEAIRDHHDNLFKSPGHRENMLLPAYDEVGLGQQIGATRQQGQFWQFSSYVTEKFSNSGLTYITGVVINDLNNDDFYNVGEGLGNVRVTVQGLGLSTTTTSSGYYAIAVPDGSYTVTFSGGGLGATQTRQVTVNGFNVKVDIEAGAPGSNPPPGPTTNTIIDSNSSGRQVGTTQNDRIEGRNGNDKLYGGDGDDRILGGNHNDLIFGQGGRDFAAGGNGADTLSGNNQDDTLYGGAGNDRVFGGADADKLFGGSGRDYINGGSGNDTIKGDGQNDSLHGGAGDDLVIGGTGNDLVKGDAGDDQLFGSSGNDRLIGNSGADTMRGDGGNDKLYGGAQNDRLFGGNQNDLLFGDTGNDFLSGGFGNDTLNGGAGADDLRGGRGNDRLLGGNGNDRMAGEIGNDLLDGGAGNDVLSGGAGNDTLIGRAGADRFVFDGGRDVIRYSDADGDTIDVSAFNLANTSDLQGTLSQRGTTTVANFGGGDILVIQNATGLDLGDFIL